MANIKLKDRSGTEQTYNNVNSVTIPNVSGGGSTTFTNVGGTYTVSFSVNSAITGSMAVPQGSSIGYNPYFPNVQGQSFLGWYTGAGGTGTQIAFPYTPTQDTTLYAKMVQTVVVGFTGMTTSSGSLTWTDDAASLPTYTTSAVGDYVNVTCGLDGVFPFNQIGEITDSENNVFTTIPKLYMKWVVDGSGNIDGAKFANAIPTGETGWFVPDCFANPSDATFGSSYLDYIAIGKYEGSGSSTKMYSKPGQTCLASLTRANFRTAARAYGNASNYYNGYQQLDFSTFILYNLLCCMYYSTENIQTVFAGRTSSSAAQSTGSCDGLSGKNGWNTNTNCVKMLGVENPYGNINKWVDGVYFSSQTIYAQRNPTAFADSASGAVTLGISRTSTSGYTKYLKKGTSDASQSYAYVTDATGTADTYTGDYSVYSSSGVVLGVGGYWVSGSLAGLWYLYGNYDASSSSTNIGGRLLLRPL